MQLLVQLQDKEQVITSLTEENDHMSSALNAAESRLSELYTEQNRMEEEMSARIEVAEKLRQQVRELEKEKRDLTRRYNEQVGGSVCALRFTRLMLCGSQTSTFEAERQTFYDNETHLKSRIQSLMQARRNQPPPTPTSPSLVDVTDTEDEGDEEQEAREMAPSSAEDDEASEPAEMTAVRMELSTLESSYASMQNTVSLLQHQLSDLKRVNRTLQEDNESYMILLREKTLSGQFNVMRMGNTSEGSESSSDLDTDEREEEGDQSSMRSGSRSYLGTVSEHPDEADETLDPEYDNQLNEDGERLVDGEGSESALGGSRSRHVRRAGSMHSPKQRGESLANLPISGPGLDLAAELGRAENKDVVEDRIDPPPSARTKKGRKSTGDVRGGMEPSDSANDIHAMRSRVKMLEDANKALSLYASKIIDRIIAQEGFEHVLAVDYEANKSPATPGLAALPPAKEEKHRRRATMFAGSAGSQMQTSPQPERLTTFESIMSPKPSMPPPTTAPANKRRSLSFDWRGFSLFGGDKKPDTSPTIRPPPLQTGVRNVSGPNTARKLDTEEDEEDRKERERLHATMKLMGIEKPLPPPMVKSHTAPDSTSITPATPTDPSSARSSPPSRFSFFRRPVTSETSSIRSTPSTSEEPGVLTHDALVRSEAESTLAALDAHERQLSVELAKGGSSGFTEIQRKSRRGRASGGGSGSGSTVWSAGMSHQGEHGDE